MKQKNKIAASILIIIVALALAAVFTGAYFTDMQASDNNAITAGTVGPTVTTTQPFDLPNAQPGHTGDALIDYYNDPFVSTLPVKYRVTATEAAGGDATLFAMLTAQAWMDDGTGTFVKVGGSQPLSTFTILPSDVVAAGLAGTVNPGDTQSWKFTVTFPTSADNTMQGLTSGFSFVFDTTQDNNPGWVQ